MISVRFQSKSFKITVIQVWAPTSNTEEAEVEQFYEDLQGLQELTPQKYVLFFFYLFFKYKFIYFDWRLITGDWNAK